MKNKKNFDTIAQEVPFEVVPKVQFTVGKNNDANSHYSWRIAIHCRFQLTFDNELDIRTVSGVAESLNLDNGYRIVIRVAELFQLEEVIAGLKVKMTEINERKNNTQINDTNSELQRPCNATNLLNQ